MKRLVTILTTAVLVIGLGSVGAREFRSHSFSHSSAGADARERMEGRIHTLCSDRRMSRTLWHFCEQWARRPPTERPPEDDNGEVVAPPVEPPTDENDNVITEPPEDDEDEVEVPSGLLEIEAEILRLTNEIRQGQGLPAVQHQDQLHRAARKHSEDMASGGFMSHTGSDGSSPGQRIRREGYNYRTFGENVAMGYRSAEAVMNAWMSSPGHRQNILGAAFCDLGVGVAYRGSTPYYTQKFACR